MKRNNSDTIRKIGITTLYAGGKGTVSEIFAGLGAKIIDFDVLAKDAVAPGKEAFHKIVAAFGAKVVLPDGELDRKEMAKIVFENKEALDKLNSIVHPIVIRDAEQLMANEWEKQADRKFALNIPLLFEANLQDWVDIIIVINTPVELCIQRGILRDGLTENEIKKRLENQIPLNEKIPLADYVIENSGTKQELIEQVHRIWRELYTASH